jgi:predicted nucleic-acid-binding protein
VIGLDTNVLLRYLLKDDEIQWQRATHVLESGETFFISTVVLCELCWVLQKGYKLERSEVINVIQALLDTDAFQLENRNAIQSTLQLMQTDHAGFADYLIGALNQQAGCNYSITFDQRLASNEHWQLL